MPEPDSTDDPRWASSEPRLVAAIRDEILSAPDRRITFARFMERALTEPGLGYYATSHLRPTREGDFLTAPELHPLFGRCIGRWIAAVRDSSARVAGFRVHEYGAGRGTLRDTARGGIDADVTWVRRDLPDRSDTEGGPASVVLANEYLDALPVHRMVERRGLQEAWVTWRAGWFAEVLAPPSTTALADHLAADGVELALGQRADVCLLAPRWIEHVAGSLMPGGVVLVIDYGHEAAELYGPRRLAGSLLTYRGHAVGDDPFEAVGHADITAHVDFSALERAARDAGLSLVGATTQGPFLAALGLGDMLAELGRQPRTELVEYATARGAVARLLDPRHLGGFRVLAWARPHADGAKPAPPGFDAAP